jgi:hypothetical protein
MLFFAGCYTQLGTVKSESNETEENYSYDRNITTTVIQPILRKGLLSIIISTMEIIGTHDHIGCSTIIIHPITGPQ